MTLYVNMLMVLWYNLYLNSHTTTDIVCQFKMIEILVIWNKSDYKRLT